MSKKTKPAVDLNEMTTTTVAAHIPPEMTDKPKLALCMSKSALPQTFQRAFRSNIMPIVLPMDELLFDVPTAIHDRADCETDETLVQLLPYTLVSNMKGEIFSYYRGGAGNEARLHGNISIGIGGHVDFAPDAPGAIALHGLLNEEAGRELTEEIGVPALDAEFEFFGVIIDPTNAVGRVHLGLLSHHRLNDFDRLMLEDGMIEKGEFRSLMDLRRPEIYDRLENWSKAVVDLLLANPKWCLGCTPANCQGCAA